RIATGRAWERCPFRRGRMFSNSAHSSALAASRSRSPASSPPWGSTDQVAPMIGLATIQTLRRTSGSVRYILSKTRRPAGKRRSKFSSSWFRNPHRLPRPEAPRALRGGGIERRRVRMPTARLSGAPEVLKRLAQGAGDADLLLDLGQD